jgi:arginase family enzyme
MAEGGPKAEALAQVFRHLAQTGQIVAVSLSTWNPKLDTDGRSKELCLNLLQALLSSIP